MRISDWSSDVCSSDLPDRLAGYANCPLIPIDIIELHRHDVAGTQPKPSQQQDQCSVANTDGCRRVACRDDLPDRFTIHVAGNLLSRSPRCHAARGQPLGWAFPPGYQKAAEATQTHHRSGTGSEDRGAKREEI